MTRDKLAPDPIYTFWPGNLAPTHFTPGDFLLTHTRFHWRDPGTIDGLLIGAGQRLRHSKQYSWPTHAALVVSRDGDLIEAKSKGVVKGHASEYQPLDYYLVQPEYNQEGGWGYARDVRRSDALFFANEMLGTKYGWFTDVSLGLSFLTGSKLLFERSGTVICSGFVAAAVGTAQWRADPSHVCPADLAAQYKVNFREVSG